MDKYAFVTGTDYGLGFELVKQLLLRGYTVFAGCHVNTFDQYKDLSLEYGKALHFIHLDINDSEHIQNAKEAIGAVTDRLDLLINNAGVLGEINSTIEDVIDFDDVEHVINVNSIGTLKVTNAMFPFLINGEDKLILTISSEAGSISDCQRDSWFGYCMSKSALNMAFTLIQNHFKKYQGQVILVHPGWMKTYMRGGLDTNAELEPEYSADCIMKLISNRKLYPMDKAIYLDYLGNQMCW